MLNDGKNAWEGEEITNGWTRNTDHDNVWFKCT